ncbi:Hypothetical protein FKW44_021658, partial [Caligus rogercresseyi]
AIILGAAARYEALDVKIPDPGSPSWKWAGDCTICAISLRSIPESSEEDFKTSSGFFKE